MALSPFVRRLFSLHQALADRFYTLELHLHGLKLGQGVRAQGRARIQCFAGKIVLHDGVILRSRDYGYHTQIVGATKLMTDAPDARIEIGARSRLNGTTVHAKGSVTIGQDCYFAAGTTIVDCDGHVLDPSRRAAGERDEPRPVSIGDRVWTGQGVMILKGVTIGAEVVIGAGSVVTGDLPAGTICAGQPARVLKEQAQ